MKIRSRSWTAAALVMAAAACNDSPIPAPGTLTAVLASPNGAEGAAVLSFASDGVGEIGPVSGEVFSRVDGDSVTVVLVHEQGGELAFSMALADTTALPLGVVREVAAPNDRLRTTLAGYEVVFRHSFTWVTAHDGERIVGFVNVAWDGDVHFFLLDTTVAPDARGRGIARRLVEEAIAACRGHGEWLHVDADEELMAGLYEPCGFERTPAGVLDISDI